MHVALAVYAKAGWPQREGGGWSITAHLCASFHHGTKIAQALKVIFVIYLSPFSMQMAVQNGQRAGLLYG